MKLIDLLVQELPKLGGWPHGCSHHLNGFLLRNKVVLVIESRQRFFEDWGGETVNEDQYEDALAASQQPVWSGDGSPPVGCECEAYDGLDWYPAVVVGHCDGFTFAWNYDHRITFTVNDVNAHHFRPIRTEAERKREETTKAIMEIVSAGNGISANLYEAIASGKIPGVKLE